MWTQRKFDSQEFDPECRKWLLLLLQLVDITGDNPHNHFHQFILGKSAVVKKYRWEIKKYVSVSGSCVFVVMEDLVVGTLNCKLQMWLEAFER